MFYRFALIGHPTAHSLSPIIHQAALKHFALDGSYELIDTPEHHLVKTLAYVRNEGFTGVNVTIPHKQNFLQLANNLTSQAKLTQAVNCLRIEEQSLLTGHNTDLDGFKNTLMAYYGAHTESAFVFGAGGAARAAIWGLIELGCKQITLIARSEHKACLLIEQVKNTLACDSGVYVNWQNCDASKSAFQPQLIVNATSIGLDNRQAPPDWIGKLFKQAGQHARFLDLVYAGPGKTTPLVALAERHGLKSNDGLVMLVEQAKLSFQFWTNLDCPIEVMLKAIGFTVKK